MSSYSIEHTCPDKCNSCFQNAKEQNSLFTTLSLVKGERFHIKGLDFAEILFLHTGKIQIEYHKPNFVLSILQGEMILLSEKTEAEFKILEDSIALFMRIENYDSICRNTLLSNSPSYLNSVDFLKPFLLSVDHTLICLSEVLISLIKKGINCLYYQGLIRKTVFFLFEMSYTKEQVTNFFYPILTRGFKFKNFIYNNYKQVPTVIELIELSKLSRSAFYKIFKEEFGLPAKKWLVQKKMALIAEKFKDDQLTIKEIMFDVGFDNHSQFTRFCKTNFGDTPSNLIRKYRV